jgi:hypothetical protein
MYFPVTDRRILHLSGVSHAEQMRVMTVVTLASDGGHRLFGQSRL